MTSVESAPALIGIDWGTSSLRAFLIDADGVVIDRMSSGEGIMHVPGQRFEEVFDRLVAPWTRQGAVPILASGMITSRNGWVETPYLETPVGPGQLAGSLVRHQTASGTEIHFVTGIMTEHGSGPDVMRGEETQIIGASVPGLSDGLFVMPGTHSKWVRVVAGEIRDFSTYMTGDVFAALKTHTILGTLMEAGPFQVEGFEKGVAVGRADGANLLHNLFHVRTLPLMGKIPPTMTADYLSGLLIGTEIAAAAAHLDGGGQITLVGHGDLTERYDIALRAVGLESRRAPDDIVVQGHVLIARATGLVK